MTISVNILKGIINRLDFGIVIYDNDGNILLWNDMVKKSFPIYNDTLNLSAWMDYVSVFETDTTTVFRQEEYPVSCALKGIESKNRKMFVVNNGDIKTGRFIEVSAYPILDEQGQSIGAFSAFKDITRSMKLEMLFTDISNTVEHMKNLFESEVQTILS